MSSAASADPGWPGTASGPPGSAAVAAGSAYTADAAAAVLAAGGSAVDAAVAAGFVACAAEPGLTSPAGGGFLQVRTPDGQTAVLDFFVDAPGLGAPGGARPPMRSVVVRFSTADQAFAVGPASVAVPGALDGWAEAHRRWGRLPLAALVAPAAHLARAGLALEPAPAAVLGLIADVLAYEPAGRALYAPAGRPVAAGECFANLDLGAMLDLVADGATTWADPRLAGRLLAGIGPEGLVTAEDLEHYRPVLREPLLVQLEGGTLTTNPPPSFGGAVVADSLARLAPSLARGRGAMPWPELVRSLTAATAAVKTGAGSKRGTTHVSVVDADGMVAAMTTSNGSCAGVLLPGLGVELNNMLGESDLHPLGHEAAAPGTRIGSMMAPTVWSDDEGDVVALGSGGSERIRSALLEVVVAYAVGGHDLAGAVAMPRVHPDDDGVLHLEPGHEAPVVEALRALGRLRTWPARDFFFGGVHAVVRGPDGAVTAVADTRRGGAARVVRP